MHATMFEKTSAAQGTPLLFVLPKNLGAFPVLAMKTMVLELTYREELPADMTASTMSALIRLAAGAMPASESEIVRGDAAVRDPEARRRLSSYGMRMPMKNTMPT